MDALHSHKALGTNVTGHNLSIRRLVLPAWDKATVSMGELLVHHYGPISHPMSCKPTQTNSYFNSDSHHHPLQQTGCDLPWFTEPSVTAKHPWWAQFLKSTPQSTWAGKSRWLDLWRKPGSKCSKWHRWRGHLPITNKSNLQYKPEHEISLEMTCERSSIVLQFVMWKWHKYITTYQQTFTGIHIPVM